MTATTLADLQASPNALARHYRRFKVGERLLLSGHSHQAWPDVGLEGLIRSFEVAAEHVDDKWDLVFGEADKVRAAYRGWLGDPSAEIALSANTHDLVVRFLSGLDLRRRPRLVTSDAEFHTLRRQLTRLAEEGVEVVRVEARPVDSLAERMAAQVDDRTAAVLISRVLYETSRIVPDIGALAGPCAAHGAELLVDMYHALGVLPVDLAGDGLGSAWVTGGGYKYLQFGEGNAFLRLPPHADRMRPVITGWFSEFTALSDAKRPGEVVYGAGPDRFAGGTYDGTSNYRAAAVAAFFAEHGLTAHLLREVSLHQRGLLARCFDDLGLPERVITRDRETPPEGYGGFLSLQTRHAAAARAVLRERGVFTDSRGDYLRMGPAPYLSDAQIEAAVAILGEVMRDLGE